MSDAETEKKLCKNDQTAAATSSANGCATSGTHSVGIVDFYVDGGRQKPTWPSHKASTAGDEGSENVAKNITGLTKDEKVKVAEHLAKSIEGGEVVEIRSVSSTSVMVNACYDMPKTRHGLGAYACLGLGSNLIRVSSGELIAKPAYIQSPVDIKLPCSCIQTLPMDIPKHAVTCVAMLIILHR